MAVGRWHCLHGLLTHGCSPVPVASTCFLLGSETTSFKVWWQLRACRRYTYWLTSLCGWVVSFIVYLHREPFFVPIQRSLYSPWLHIWHGWAALRRGWWCAEDTQLHASFLLFGCMADVINSTTSRARLEEIKCSFIWVCVPTSSSFSVWFSRVTGMIISILIWLVSRCHSSSACGSLTKSICAQVES